MREKEQTIKKPGALGSAARNSVILTLFRRFADFIYGSVRKSFVGRVLTGYESEGESSRQSLIVGSTAKFGYRNWAQSAKLGIMRAFERSVVLTGINRWMHSLLGWQIKIFSVFGLSFGIFTSGFHMLVGYYTGGIKDYGNLIFGAAAALLSLPLLLDASTLASTIRSSRIARFLLFDTLGLTESSFKDVSPSNPRHPSAVFAAGIVAGALTLLISPLKVLLLMLAAICVYTLLVRPECGVVAICFILPFSGLPLLCTVSAVSFIGYLCKVLRGKRTMKFGLLDVTVLIFDIVILVGGIFSVSRDDSMPTALIMLCALACYCMAVNMYKTKKWLLRCSWGIVTSLTVTSLIGLWEQLTSAVALDASSDRFNFGVVNMFNSDSAYAAYLLLAVPFVLPLISEASTFFRKIFLSLIFASSVLMLFYTPSVGAWIGFIIGLLLFCLVMSRMTIPVAILGCVCVPFLPMFLPDNIKSYISSAFYATYNSDFLVNMRSSLLMARDNFIGGGGLGTYPVLYRLYSTESVPVSFDSGNMFLQILIELGIFGLITFLFVLLVFAQSNFSCYINYRDRIGKKISAAGFAGVLSLCILGLVSYPFEDMRIYLLFWIVIGIASALRRIEKRENSYAYAYIE